MVRCLRPVIVSSGHSVDGFPFQGPTGLWLMQQPGIHHRWNLEVARESRSLEIGFRLCVIWTARSWGRLQRRGDDFTGLFPTTLE